MNVAVRGRQAGPELLGCAAVGGNTASEKQKKEAGAQEAAVLAANKQKYEL